MSFIRRVRTTSSRFNHGLETGDKCQPNPYEPLRFYADQDGVQNVFSDYFNCVDEVAQGNSGNPKVFTVNCISL